MTAFGLERPVAFGEPDHLVIIDAPAIVNSKAVSAAFRDAAIASIGKDMPPEGRLQRAHSLVVEQASSDPSRPSRLYQDAEQMMRFIQAEPTIFPVVLGREDDKSVEVQPDLDFLAASLRRYSHAILGEHEILPFIGGLRRARGTGYQLPTGVVREGGIAPTSLRSATFITRNPYTASRIAETAAVDRTVFVERQPISSKTRDNLHPTVTTVRSLGQVPFSKQNH